jgi:3-methylcrotonyl-CoA carboxylase alpha subunit
VYSEADRGALHVSYADEAFLIGPAAAAESYLKVEALLEAALRAGAQAVHPAYGFWRRTRRSRGLSRGRGWCGLGESIGYPLLIKAAAGGGGKGMEVVESAAERPGRLRALRLILPRSG